MGDQQGTETRMPDPSEIASVMSEIAERSQRLVTDFVSKQMENGGMGSSDPLGLTNTFLEMTSKMMADPSKLMQAQMTLWQDYLNLWQNTTARMLGGDGQGGEIKPDRDDRRFRDEAWENNEVFNFMKQSYLLTSRWLYNTVTEVEGLDEKTAKKVEFYTRQFIDALSPTNFAMTNPEVLRATVESGGENLINGLNNMLSDMEKGGGQLRISMTDMDAFEVGRNVAVTPGKVVFRNDLLELIQYVPTTDKVHKLPLVVVPAWINKYYILDLREKNSFVKWATDQGFTVFIISWVNPDARLAQKHFEDYITEGTVAALDAVEQATGERGVNMVGYCIGGTLLAATVAYLAAKGDDRVKSATFLTTMTDFSEPGELGVFIDEHQVSGLEEKMNERGYLEGSEMATTFNMLRANDLIWSFVINNYLLGKDPFPFDLLYWNADSTRMPAVMHSYYLRNFYMKNLLVEPGGVTLAGVPIDLRQVNIPTYVLSTREDHIAPWKSTYKATQIYSGPVRFVLAASGHIAGVINPPAAGKYPHWVNTGKPPADPDEWFEGAAEKPGSWWPDWDKWVSKYSGPKTVPARVPGDGALEVLEDAPGSFVKAKA
ncbi:MAG: class I poly(R)-hydroxyalkanoic acid synthase [Hyphomicrobiales bacterium]|nr:class I poly(R)-hydroxyalkanoic acid synthase [Hyphomicrobiales bacterium]MCP5372827.1 class I poly(R)-hydroxyalkanoic acid synthase [Hyphomicrobiales bacterium]